MEQNQLKDHQGYLLIISAAIIIVISIVATLVIGMFTGGVKSTGNVAESSSAFYLANSGLQIAKRDIIVNKEGCSLINGTTLYTNATLTNIPGQYTINGCSNSVNNSLAGAIGNSILLTNTIIASSTLNSLSGSTIALASSTGFATNGTIKIDNEYISYRSISGSTLQNITRGVGGTTAATHNNGAAITQNQCTLTATAGSTQSRRS